MEKISDAEIIAINYEGAVIAIKHFIVKLHHVHQIPINSEIRHKYQKKIDKFLHSLIEIK